LKTSVPPESLSRALGAAIREMDATVPVSNVTPMTQLIARSIDEPRFLALITGVFATMALLLAAIGIYGVMAYAVTERRAEIGVRLALGARRADVFGLVYADGLKLAVMGLILGAAGAALLAPALTTLLFGIEPIDAVTFGATAVALLVVATLAVVIPAYRATRLDPAVTLRGD
jgi:putative ABC transport system permease protein